MTRSRGVLTLAAHLSRGALASLLLLAACSSHGSSSNAPPSAGAATTASGSTSAAAAARAGAGAASGAAASGATSGTTGGSSASASAPDSAVSEPAARACPSKPGEACVTGTIAYRERMALPPQAVITMQLADVSLADAPATTLDEYTFEAGGRQVPFAFALRYDPAAIDGRHEYAVQARIALAGKLLFINDTRVSVITRGQPSTAAIMLVRVK